MRLFLFAGAASAAIASLAAGRLGLQPKETTPPSVTQSEPWQFTIAVLGWLAGMDDTIGVRGVNADIDIGFDQVPQHLGMRFAARAEGAKSAIWNIRSINLKRHYSKLLFAALALAPMAFLS